MSENDLKGSFKVLNILSNASYIFVKLGCVPVNNFPVLKKNTNLSSRFNSAKERALDMVVSRFASVVIFATATPNLSSTDMTTNVCESVTWSVFSIKGSPIYPFFVDEVATKTITEYCKSIANQGPAEKKILRLDCVAKALKMSSSQNMSSHVNVGNNNETHLRATVGQGSNVMKTSDSSETSTAPTSFLSRVIRTGANIIRMLLTPARALAMFGTELNKTRLKRWRSDLNDKKTSQSNIPLPSKKKKEK